MDHLIHVLIYDVVPFFVRKQHRHEMGFEGDDLQTKKRQKIVERAQAFMLKDINSPSVYLVASKSRAGVSYTVNIDAWSCDCPDYP
ncbi:hypothetical protein C8F01DRAFT_930122, partial [Mycena amicta]